MVKNTAQNLKDTAASTQEIKQNLETAIADAKGGKLQVGAVVRLIVLVIAWLNQIAITFGAYSVPEVSESVVYIIGTVITIIATLISYWQNNSWTLNAKTADAIFDVLGNAGVSVDDICDAVGSIIDERREHDDEDDEAETN